MDNDLKLKDFVPQSKLVTPTTSVDRPRFPVVDAHNHLGEGFGGGWIRRPVQELLDVMDESGVACLVDLDGGWGEDKLNSHLDYFKAAAPERFALFGGVDWSRLPEYRNRFGDWAAARLKDQVLRGAQGLKIWKLLGLSIKDSDGTVLPIDAPLLDPIWETAAELNIPVTIHIADPVAFFDPVDASNERWEELQEHPDWQFPSPPGPSFLSLLEALARVVKNHPATTFIGAHVGCYAENLSWVSALLDEAPNFNVDISARIGELGRQPYTSRRFFEKYSDRILFGLDSSPNPVDYRLYYRFLETQDEYFNYSTGPVPTQGRWYIYGLDLPDTVTEKVYHKNAERIILHEGIIQ